jgi:hypothetical protein
METEVKVLGVDCIAHAHPLLSQALMGIFREEQ